MSEERIQKLLARAGHGSRRQAEDLIVADRVTVNGRVANLGDKADPDRDTVKVDGKRVDLHAVPHRYFLMHKPRGVLTARTDGEGDRQTVLDLVPPGLRKGLVPVGRLDYQTSGLLLLTTDGDFAHRLAHPRYGCTKLYEVKVHGQPTEAQLDRLRQGRMKIEDKRIGPCRIEAMPSPPGDSSDNSWWRVELAEGRNRQIRDMFFRIGHSVQKLRRVAIGPISDAALPMGQLRELSEGEVQALLQSTSKTVAKGDVEFRLDSKPKKPAAAKTRKPRFPRRSAAKPGGKPGGTKGGSKARGAGKRSASPGEGSSKGRSRPSGGRPSSGNKSRSAGGGRGSGTGSSSGGSSSGGSSSGGRSGSGPSKGPRSKSSTSRGPGSRGPSSRGSSSRGPSSRGSSSRGPGSRGPSSKGSGPSRGPGRGGKKR